jgi:hypothetical protein
MSQWDGPARDRLQVVVEQFKDTRVTPVLEAIVARVWRANTARYEPSDLGDTPRSLGITASENIRELTLRERWSTAGAGELGQDVHIAAPNGSLLVESHGVNLLVKKANSMVTLMEPDWSNFEWASESDVRQAAARNNRARYNPFQIGSGTLFDGVFPAEGDAKALRDVILVWAAGSSSPYTAGWLGIPTESASHPWLAVQRLWWHQADGGAAQRDCIHRTDSEVDTFERRPLPQPEIRMKPKPKTAGE